MTPLAARVVNELFVSGGYSEGNILLLASIWDVGELIVISGNSEEYTIL